MARLLKLTGLLAVITVVVWAVTLWRWRVTAHAVATQDVVLYLLALPLLLFAVVLAAMRLRVRRHAPATATAPAAASATPEAAETHAPAASALLLAASLQLPVGRDACSALATLAAGTTLPEPDEVLRDDEGFPLLTARDRNLDIEPVRAVLQDLQAALVFRQVGWQGRQPSDALLRALALLSGPLAEVLETVAQRLPACGLGPHPAGDDREVVPTCTLYWGMPAMWTEFEQALAQSWLARMLEEASLSTAGWPLIVEPVEGPTPLLLRIDRQIASWHEAGRPGPLLALACDSLLDEQRVRTLARQGRLHTTRNPQGVVPGEGAAVALFVPGNRPDDRTSPTASGARVHRMAMRQRSEPAGTTGRVDSGTLLDTAREAVARTGLTPDHWAGIVTDADLRHSCTTEVMETVMQLCPTLDVAEQCVRLGLACGDTGVAGGLCSLVLGAAQALSETGPALVMTALHPRDRLAVVVSPPTIAATA